MQVPFEQWFPLPLTLGTVLMFFVTLALVLAGSLVGLVIKELEVYQANGNPRSFKILSGENKLFLLLGVGIAVGFWIANMPAMYCFIYSTGLKTGLGTIRNYLEVKKNHNGSPASPPTSNVTASITGMGVMPPTSLPEQVTSRTPHVPPKAT